MIGTKFGAGSESHSCAGLYPSGITLWRLQLLRMCLADRALRWQRNVVISVVLCFPACAWRYGDAHMESSVRLDSRNSSGACQHPNCRPYQLHQVDAGKIERYGLVFPECITLERFRRNLKTIEAQLGFGRPCDSAKKFSPARGLLLGIAFGIVANLLVLCVCLRLTSILDHTKNGFLGVTHNRVAP